MPSVFQSFLAQLQDLRAQHRPPITAGSRGTKEDPVIPGRPYRDDQMRRSGYTLAPIDPALFQDADENIAIELINERNKAIAQRVQDDFSDYVADRVNAKFPPTPGVLIDDANAPIERVNRDYLVKTPSIQAGDHANTNKVRGLETPEYPSSADIRNYQRLYANPFSPDGPLDLVSDESLNKDDDLQQTGWLPADFGGMSHADAAALIADQLRTRRIRQMGELSPDYLATLPIY